MKKVIVPLLLLLTAGYFTQAQTKVFKEVSDDISSQIKVIKQDNALVGYLAFTRLEKAGPDSFNYRITIMDENLNDIGKVEFREVALTMQDVTFDQDVLCLGYYKTDSHTGKKSNKKESDQVFFQFVNLQGTILKTYAVNVTPAPASIYYGYGSSVTADKALKSHIQLRNTSKKGFVCFYGDNSVKKLLVFNFKGDLLWDKKVTRNADAYYLLTAGTDIYLLNKSNHVVGTEPIIGGYEQVNNEGDYELTGYSTADSSTELHFQLKDDRGNDMKVLTFDNDLATGRPYIAGCIINPDKVANFTTGREISRKPYLGLFTFNINGIDKSSIKKTCSYWADGASGLFDERGYVQPVDAFAHFTEAFRDFDGNTYFSGSQVIKRPRWGCIASSIITLPLIIPPPFILGFGGLNKYKVTDALVVKQGDRGTLTLENTIPSKHSGFQRPIVPLWYFDRKSFGTVYNQDSKANYLIVDDPKNISIYNVNQKKVVRTIAHKEGKTTIEVFPAKEGAIMVSEYNKKEKSTRFSIETL